MYRSVKVEPRYNKAPRNLQNLFAIPRFRYIEVLFHIIYYYRGKENRSLHRGLHCIEVRLSKFHCICTKPRLYRQLYNGRRNIEISLLRTTFWTLTSCYEIFCPFSLRFIVFLLVLQNVLVHVLTTIDRKQGHGLHIDVDKDAVYKHNIW